MMSESHIDVARNYLIGNLVKMKDANILAEFKNAKYIAHKPAMIVGPGKGINYYMLYFPCDNYVRGPYPESAFEFVADTLAEYRQ